MSAHPGIDPILGPATRLLWRGEHTVQLELGGRAVVVDGIDHAAIRRLVAGRGPARRRERRDRTAGPAGLVPVPDEATRLAFAALAEAGFLWTRTSDEDDLRLAPPAPRLASELAALTARFGEQAAEVLNARRQCAVAVQGEGRAGPLVAALLAAAGVGRVHVGTAGTAHLGQALPGGIGPGDEGSSFAEAAAAAVLRSAPETAVAPLPMGERPDLVVLAVDDPVDTEQRDALHARDCTHLAVRVGIDVGVVGPLVIPGLTSCLRCADLHRLDRDPAWSALAVQLGARRRTAAASDVCLATIVAGMAATQALAYLDGTQPAAVDGTLELHLPDWQPRRRSWPVHPQCDCAGAPVPVSPGSAQ